MDYKLIDKKLGMIYSEEKTIFRLWSPLKENIELLLYEDGEKKHRKSYLMNKDEDGVHERIIDGNLEGYYYTYLIDGQFEVTDPYSIASSLNSKRSAIIDLSKSNPIGWEDHLIPKDNNFTDAIIYEVHIKDFTGHKSSGVTNRGKFLGMVEQVSHLKDLGVTHIHLLPIYDFFTVNEDEEYFKVDTNYNWGYDPELYNVVEGSYSTRPEEPINRIIELKKMIMAIHKAGLKVIIDIVYNHTYKNIDSNFNIIMPGYYHRLNEDGNFSNGSGCGNEIASENTMVRKFILDSILYWVEEFKIDGLRFDLMALTDIDTIEEIINTVRKINPDILIYGEPWAGGPSTLPEEKMTTKGRQSELSFALFNDDFRDSIKGDNNGIEKGFSQGNIDCKMATKTGIAGSINYSHDHKGFANSPRETINYINAHDDLIIYDKMKKTFPLLDEEGIIRLNKFAFSILFTSQGIPFFHGGNEFLRSKNMISNTYNQPLSINGIDWSLKEKNLDFYHYFRDLIKLRKIYSEFRLRDSDSIKRNLKFLNRPDEGNSIAYTLSLEEENKFLFIVHNGNQENLFFSSNVIREHLIKNYGIQNGDLRVCNILDINGLVENKEVKINPSGIDIPNVSTSVYEIWTE